MMGNSSGNLREWWEAFAAGEHTQGGFVWDWVDQGLRTTTAAHRSGHKRAEVSFFGYGGDFGEPLHDAQFCINGLVFPDRTPHPGLAELKHVMRPVAATLVSWEVAAEKKSAIATVAVTTRYDTPPRAALRLEVSLAVDGALLSAAPPRPLPELQTLRREAGSAAGGWLLTGSWTPDEARSRDTLEPLLQAMGTPGRSGGCSPASRSSRRTSTPRAGR